MFMGPMDGSPDFRDSGMEGMYRFVRRVWRMFNQISEDGEDKELTIKLHQTIKKVTNDISKFGYNTAISAMMEYVNALNEKSNYSKMYLKPLAIMLAPFAPYMVEEVWEKWGESYSIHKSSWPEYQEQLTQVSEITIPIQINGKVRGQIVISQVHVSKKEEVLSLAKADVHVASWIQDKEVVSEIYVPGKIVNLVTK